MSKLRNSIAARMGYGFIFIIVIPFLLWSGAVAWEPYMKLVPVYSPVCGGALAVIGLVLMLGSMISLKIQGGGLPMNAFPPPPFCHNRFLSNSSSSDLLGILSDLCRSFYMVRLFCRIICDNTFEHIGLYRYCLGV